MCLFVFICITLDILIPMNLASLLLKLKVFYLKLSLSH